MSWRLSPRVSQRFVVVALSSVHSAVGECVQLLVDEDLNCASVHTCRVRSGREHCGTGSSKRPHIQRFQPIDRRPRVAPGVAGFSEARLDRAAQATPSFNAPRGRRREKTKRSASARLRVAFRYCGDARAVVRSRGPVERRDVRIGTPRRGRRPLQRFATYRRMASRGTLTSCRAAAPGRGRHAIGRRVARAGPREWRWILSPATRTTMHHLTSFIE